MIVNVNVKFYNPARTEIEPSDKPTEETIKLMKDKLFKFFKVPWVF